MVAVVDEIWKIFEKVIHTVDIIYEYQNGLILRKGEVILTKRPTKELKKTIQTKEKLKPSELIQQLQKIEEHRYKDYTRITKGLEELSVRKRLRRKIKTSGLLTSRELENILELENIDDSIIDLRFVHNQLQEDLEEKTKNMQKSKRDETGPGRKEIERLIEDKQEKYVQLQKEYEELKYKKELAKPKNVELKLTENELKELKKQRKALLGKLRKQKDYWKLKNAVDNVSTQLNQLQTLKELRDKYLQEGKKPDYILNALIQNGLKYLIQKKEQEHKTVRENIEDAKNRIKEAKDKKEIETILNETTVLTDKEIETLLKEREIDYIRRKEKKVIIENGGYLKYLFRLYISDFLPFVKKPNLPEDYRRSRWNGMPLYKDRYDRVARKGIYLIIPFYEALIKESMQERVLNLGSISVPTTDEKSQTMFLSCNIRYKIKDLYKACMEVHDYEESLKDHTLSILAKHSRGKTFKQWTDSKNVEE